MLDEKEFLSPYGIRSLSRVYGDAPYTLALDGDDYCIGYEPGESQTGMFGGNSNWRVRSTAKAWAGWGKGRMTNGE